MNSCRNIIAPVIYEHKQEVKRTIESLIFQYKRPKVTDIVRSAWSQELGFYSVGEILIHFGYSPIQCWPEVCRFTNSLNERFYEVELSCKKNDPYLPTPKQPRIYDVTHIPWSYGRTCFPRDANLRYPHCV